MEPAIRTFCEFTVVKVWQIKELLKIGKLDELEKYKNEIKEMYENNITLKEIAIKYNCSRDTIKKFIVQNEFPERKKINPLYKNFSEEDDKKIEQLYNEGKSTREIGKIMNTSGITISKHLQKMGVKIKDLHKSRQIYSFNENYFKTIDDEHKAYWLGFIAADGCVLEPTYQVSKRTGKIIRKEQGALQIGLQEKDKAHLEKFQKDIKDTHKINFSKKRKAYDIKILSNIICMDLQQYNIVPRKSLVLEFPDNIREDLLRHFIRGYFDGDGSIAFCKNKKGVISIGSIQVSIIGTVMFLNTLNNILEDELQFKGKVVDLGNRHKPVTKTIFFSSIAHTKKFLDFIYKDSTIYLDRKYERYLIFNKKYEEYLNKKLR